MQELKLVAERKRNWHETPHENFKINNKTKESTQKLLCTHSRCVRHNATVKTNKINRSTYEKRVNLLLLELLLQLLLLPAGVLACLLVFFLNQKHIDWEVYVVSYARNANITKERKK